MQALDTSTKTTGMGAHIASLGYQAVGIYLRPDRCTQGMLDDLHKAGIKVWSCYERGFPIRDDYFNDATQGTTDGAAAAKFASGVGQPAGTQIFATVDYDPSSAAVQGIISAYMTNFQAAVQAQGYQASVYGSGLTCRILIAAGLAQVGWLTQSTGFAEYALYKPNAGIVQLPRINNSWDGDDIADPNVVGLW